MERVYEAPTFTARLLVSLDIDSFKRTVQNPRVSAFLRAEALEGTVGLTLRSEEREELIGVLLADDSPVIRYWAMNELNRSPRIQFAFVIWCSRIFDPSFEVARAAAVQLIAVLDLRNPDSRDPVRFSSRSNGPDYPSEFDREVLRSVARTISTYLSTVISSQDLEALPHWK